MAGRKINPRAVKLHRTYDVGELATRLGVHKNSVRQWVKDGLHPIDGGRPMLFAGGVVRDFLARRNAARRSPCPPGTLYCFGCRAPRAPALSMADYIPLSGASGNVRAICGTCERLMFRRVPFARLGAVLPKCEVQVVHR